MAQNWINKIKVGDQVYNIGVNSVLVFVGTSSDENLVDGYTGSLTIGEETYAPTTKGYVVLKGTKEFVSDGTAWREFGDESQIQLDPTYTDVIETVAVDSTDAAIKSLDVDEAALSTLITTADKSALSSAALAGTISLTGTSASAITSLTSSDASVSLTSSAVTVVSGVSDSKIGLKLNTSNAADQALKSAELSGATSFLTEVSADAAKEVNAVTGITSTAATISVQNQTLILPLEVLLSAAVGSTAAVVGGLTTTTGTVGITTAAMDVLASASLDSVAAGAGAVDVLSGVTASTAEALSEASLNGTTKFLTEVSSSGFANVLADAAIDNKLSVSTDSVDFKAVDSINTGNVVTAVAADATIAAVTGITSTTVSVVKDVSLL